jgi:ProP effector
MNVPVNASPAPASAAVPALVPVPDAAPETLASAPRPAAEFATESAVAPVAESAVEPAHDSADIPALTPRALLKSLQEQFAVFRNSQPLAIGIDKALQERLPDLKKKTLRVALNLHTHTLRYLRNTARAAHRFDLDGNPADALSDEHRQHAEDTLRERLKKQAEERRAQQKAGKEAEREAEAERLRAEKLALLAEKFSRK